MENELTVLQMVNPRKFREVMRTYCVNPINREVLYGLEKATQPLTPYEVHSMINQSELGIKVDVSSVKKALEVLHRRGLATRYPLPQVGNPEKLPTRYQLDRDAFNSMGISIQTLRTASVA